MASYKTYDVSDELEKEALTLLQKISIIKTNVKKGTNEVTKAIERGTAKLVYVATDVDPPEVVAHLPILCDDKEIPYIFIKTKESLGECTGAPISCAAVSIQEMAELEDRVKTIAERIKEVRGG